MSSSPPPEPVRRNLTGAIVPALAAAALAGLGAMYLVSRQSGEGAIAAPAGCILDGADAIGGPIALVDSRGARVTEADFTARPAVLYFGFTHCPDMCPGTMYLLAEALASPDGYDVQPVLITVDPERDTPARMGQYIATDGFPPGLVGLTGTPEQVRAAAQAFHVSYSRASDVAADGGYNVNHSSFLYVVDGNWTTVAAMPTFRADGLPQAGRPAAMVPIEPDELAACITAGLERSAEAARETQP